MILLHDIRYALRILRRSPLFTAVAVLTLALGIGANTAMFSFVEAWVIRPLPWLHSERLMHLEETETNKGWTTRLAPANLGDWKRQNHVFETIAAYTFWATNLTGGASEPERITGARADEGFFPLLGVAPLRGRAFLSEECRPGSERVALVGYGLWQRRFASDPQLAGKDITLDGLAYRVIGILPADFHFPLLGRVDLWVPLALSPEERANRKGHWVAALGRLKPGVTIAQARADLNAIARRLEQAYPDTNTHRGAHVVSLFDEIGQHAGNQMLLVLFAVVGCVLLIACANVANLLLARATGRHREIAVRMAVGAGRWRLVRQLLTETSVLFAMAAAFGAWFAFHGVDWLVSLIPYQNRGFLRNYGRVDVDLTALLFTVALSLVCALLFGLAPALESTKANLHTSLKEAAGRGSSNLRGRRFRSVLVASEIALALMLLIGAGLSAKSLLHFYRLDLGFRPEGVVTAEIELPKFRYADLRQAANFYDRVLERLQSLPGVAAAGAGTGVPFLDVGGGDFFIDGQPQPVPGQTPRANINSITPGYAPALQIDLIHGRYLSTKDAEHATPVALVNQTLVRRYFPAQSPIGQRIRLAREGKLTRTIVGVVKDVVNFVDDKPGPQIYTPFAQAPGRYLCLVVRVAGDDPARLAPAIRSAVSAIDPAQPIARVWTLEQLIHDQHAPFRIISQMMSFFGGLALFLASIGIYAVMAYSVVNRTREIGIRMALGAARRDVLAMIVKQGLALVAIGVAVGLGGALALTRVLAMILMDVSPTDPATFVLLTAVLTAIALLACYIPARRATRIDPMAALRYE